MELLRKMQAGEFLVSVQIDPPDSVSLDIFKQSVGSLMKAGVNLVDVNSRRRSKHDPVLLSIALRAMGLDVIPHLTTRDATVDSLIKQMTTLHEQFDIHDHLIIRGDRYTSSQKSFLGTPDAMYISEALAHISFQLREENDLDISLGAAVNQNRSGEKEVIQAKEQAGVNFFMSQPVFSQQQIKDLVTFYRNSASRPLLIGIWPLLHLTTVEKIRQGRIDGVILPDEIYNEALTQPVDDKVRQWGIQKAADLIEQIRQERIAQGVYIVAPLRQPIQLIDLLLKVLH